MATKNRKKAQAPRPTSRRLRWPRRSLSGLILVAAFALVAVLHVQTKLAVVHLGYQLSQAATENRDLLAQSQKLQVERATLRSRQRLRELASSKLGLVEPAPGQVLRVEKQPSRLAGGSVAPGRALGAH